MEFYDEKLVKDEDSKFLVQYVKNPLKSNLENLHIFIELQKWKSNQKDKIPIIS